MRNFEDLLEELYCSTYVDMPPPVKEVDRNAPDINAENNRHKRDKRRAEKFMEFKNENHKQVTRDGLENHYVNPSLAYSEFHKWFGECSPMTERLQKNLGIDIDTSSVSVWSERSIKWQSAAQVLWVINPAAKVTHIRDGLLKNQKLFELLEFDSVTSLYNKVKEDRGRAVEDKIRLVNPQTGEKRGRPSTYKTDTIQHYEIVINPNLFIGVSRQVNVKVLKIIISTIAQVLRLLGYQTKEIRDHSLIQKYKSAVPPLFSALIDYWVV